MKKVTQIPEKYKDNNLTGRIGNPQAVYYPENIDDVVSLVNKARENKMSIVPIGAKTGVAEATYAEENSVLLSTDKLNNILDYSPETLTLTVEAGVTLDEVRDYLEDSPYFYAPDPGSKKATVGGTAATNAGGMKAVKYGVTRDNVRGMQVVLANGEVIEVGGLNKKNASGYDLKNLFIGSEGTLGVICTLQLVLHAKPQAERSVLIGFDSMTEGIPVVLDILQSPVTPAALEFLSAESLSYSEDFLNTKKVKIAGSHYLLVTVDGPDEEAVALDVERLAQVANKAEALEVKPLSKEEAKLMWRLRDSTATALSKLTEVGTYDVVVPINNIPETLIKMSQLGEKVGLDGIYFGHAGDGNIHALTFNQKLSHEELEKRIEAYDKELYPMIAANGGLPSAEHGIGLMKKKYLRDTLGDVHINVMKAVKQALDPSNVMNPGKIFD